MPDTRPNYSCTQEELYTVLELGWTNYSANIGGFTLLKGKYNPAYATSALSDISAAKILPSKQTRNAIPENMRVQLVTLGDTCLANERKLKSYLEEVFTGESTKAMLVAAGWIEYRDASSEGWTAMNTMNGLGDSFIADHTTALEAGTSNMPATFITTYKSGKTAFETVYNSYLQSGLATYGGKNAKVVANNAIYTTFTKMMSDGRLIFEDNLIIKEQFVFVNLLSQVGGVGTTGMRITVKDSITKLFNTDFSAAVQPGDKSGKADGAKFVELKMSADESYTVVVTVPGYPTHTTTGVKLKTGVMHRLDLVLVKE